MMLGLSVTIISDGRGDINMKTIKTLETLYSKFF